MKKRLFFVLMAAAAGLFAACNAVSGDEEAEAEILNSGPGSGATYSISITTEKEEEGGLAALSGTDGIVTVSPAGRVKPGATVTLSAYPQLIADDTGAGGGVGSPEYWFVKSIKGSYSMEGGPERTNVSFLQSTGVSNEWTFSMTPGDLIIDVEFTHDYPDQSNASLSAISPSAGVISPGFAKDTLSYTITVPPGTAEFSISARAENSYLTPVLLPEGGGGSLLDADLMSGDNGGPLSEGLNHYTITVTPNEGESKTYSIDVILLPDLSLQTFKIVKEEEDFERDLAAVDTQNVYIPYAEGLTVVAEANGDGASVNQEPADIPSLNVGSDHVKVTVTVSKSAGAAGEYSKDYVLNLYYGDGMDPDPLADGGYVSFIPGESAGVYYEIHTFVYTGADQALVFKEASSSEKPLMAWVLVVAGGGGGGGALYPSNGGGAGGVVEHKNYPLTAGTYSVTVGTGGAGGDRPSSDKVNLSESNDGKNGSDSSFGEDFTAKGGGGGGGSGGSIYRRGGKQGGSNGGGSGNPGAIVSGTFPDGGNSYGNLGATGVPTGDYGGTGGGAIGAGQSYALARVLKDGGAGITRNITGVDEVYAVGGGVRHSYFFPSPMINTGNGGHGGHGSNGGSGQNGIVIVRFPRQQTAAE